MLDCDIKNVPPFNLNLNEFQSMMEMRDALTTEVAQKHDQIITLKHELNQLEEQCRQINKHAQFKDDIIKELRKEIKQLKQQVSAAVLPGSIGLHFLRYPTHNMIQLQEQHPERQLVLLNQTPELDKSNETVIFMRECSISSTTPHVSESESHFSKAVFAEKPRKSQAENGIKPHLASPVIDFAGSIARRIEKIKDETNLQTDLPHRSVLRRKKKLRGFTTCSYPFKSKVDGI